MFPLLIAFTIQFDTSFIPDDFLALINDHTGQTKINHPWNYKYRIENSFYFGLTIPNGKGGAISINDENAVFSILDSLFFLLIVLSGTGGALDIYAKGGTIERTCGYQCHAHHQNYLNPLGQFALIEIKVQSQSVSMKNVIVNQCAPQNKYNNLIHTRAPLYFRGSSNNYGSFVVDSLNESSCYVSSHNAILGLRIADSFELKYGYFYGNYQTYSTSSNFIEQYGFQESLIVNCNFISNIASGSNSYSLLANNFYNEDEYKKSQTMNIISCYFAHIVVPYLFRAAGSGNYESLINVQQCYLHASQFPAKQ